MESAQVQRAVAAARSTACELGFHVNDAVVIHNSDRIAAPDRELLSNTFAILMWAGFTTMRWRPWD
ncbi:MAG: hypothetical protein R3C14_08705 [Caldilineaceae bacterium]